MVEKPLVITLIGKTMSHLEELSCQSGYSCLLFTLIGIVKSCSVAQQLLTFCQVYLECTLYHCIGQHTFPKQVKSTSSYKLRTADDACEKQKIVSDYLHHLLPINTVKKNKKNKKINC